MHKDKMVDGNVMNLELTTSLNVEFLKRHFEKKSNDLLKIPDNFLTYFEIFFN